MSAETAGTPEEAPLAPYRIESARSSRSKCKICRKAIEKGVPRLGVLIEGPFGQGYLWHHVPCVARRDIATVEEAYKLGFTAPDVTRPPLEELRELSARAEEKRQEKQTVPYVERAPSGRSKCQQCEEFIEHDTFRVVLLRTVEFYGQTRAGPVKVHPACVGDALERADNATPLEGFFDALRQNSRLPETDADAAILEIGELRGE